MIQHLSIKIRNDICTVRFLVVFDSPQQNSHEIWILYSMMRSEWRFLLPIREYSPQFVLYFLTWFCCCVSHGGCLLRLLPVPQLCWQ